MKFMIEVTCNCGGKIPFTTYGSDKWPGTACPQCGTPTWNHDPLSVSVIAERLLYRSKAEFEAGDYSLSIVIGAMAVESFLTRLFFKVKGMEKYITTFTWPSDAQESMWEAEYPRKGGFTVPADFVSKAATGMPFDEFVASNGVANKIMASLPDATNLSAKQYFQTALFNLRNRIVHWGYVNASRNDAQRCQTLAIAIVSILREMDRIKYGTI